MALSPEAKQLLILFRDNANPGGGNPADDDRWREFVIQAHNDGLPVDDGDVSRTLKEKWSNEDRCTSMGGRYYEERMLLEAYDQSRP